MPHMAITEVTHYMALLPLVWLTVLVSQGHRRSVIWWGLAVVFAVSWVADTAAHFVDPWLVSALYPLAQALVLGIVILPPQAAARWTALVIGAGLGAWSVRGIARPDIFVHTVAWVGMILVVWNYPGRLRQVVVSAFGIGWLAWVVYSIDPSWATWGLYQGVRALSLGAFCWATLPVRRAVRVA